MSGTWSSSAGRTETGTTVRIGPAEGWTTRLVAAERTGQLLSQAAGIGTWSYEPEHDRIEWSQDILNLTGYRDDEIDDIDKVGAVLHPDEAGAIRTAVMEGILYGKAGSLEHRLKDKAGGWSHWRNTFRTEPRPGGEHALRGVMQDITELVQARDGAVRGQQQMLQLIESSPFAVAMFDRRLRYLVMSGAWRQMFTRKHWTWYAPVRKPSVLT